MALYIIEPTTRAAGGIIVADDNGHEDIAEFYHNEYAMVAQSYETALASANSLVSHDALVKALRECVQDIVFCERVRDPSFNPRSLGVGTVLGDAIAALDAVDGAALPSQNDNSGSAQS